MCIAVPGKLISTDGQYGQVDVRGNMLSVAVGLVPCKPGDYLLVHAGCAIAVVSMDEAAELDDLLMQISDAT